MSVAKIKVESDVTNALAGLKRVDSAMGRMGKGGGGMGMLQVAQFADDAQYGIRGILNNIPGIAMGFGASAAAAGALSIAVLGVAKIMDGSAKRWGEGLYDKFSAASKALRTESEANRALAEQNANRIDRETEAYKKQYTVRQEGMQRALTVEERYQEIKQKEFEGGRSRVSEQLGREQALFQGVLSNRADQLGKPENLNLRLKAEEGIAKLQKRQIEEAANFDKQTAQSRMQTIQTEIDQKTAILEQSRQAEIDIAKIVGDKDSQIVQRQKDATKEAQLQVEAAEHKKKLAELELHSIDTMGKERLLTAEQERKLRLDAIGEELRLRGESEFRTAFDDASNATYAPATALQRVGLGKTPELVLQVDLARRSEKHLSEINKTIKKLSFGLN